MSGAEFSTFCCLPGPVLSASSVSGAQPARSISRATPRISTFFMAISLENIVSYLSSICASNFALRSSDCGAIWQLYPPTANRAKVLRRVFGADPSWGCYKHLVHTPPVHIQDLEGVALPIEAIADRRDASQVVHHHAAHRVVVCLLLAGQPAEPQVLPQFVSPQ